MAIGGGVPPRHDTRHNFNMPIFNGEANMELNWETHKKLVADKAQLCDGHSGLSFDAFDSYSSPDASRRRCRRSSHDDARDESRHFESRDAYTSRSSAPSKTKDERDGSSPLVRWMKRIARRCETGRSAPGEQIEIEDKGTFGASSADSSVEPSRLSSADSSIEPSRLIEHDDGTCAVTPPPGTPNTPDSQAWDDEASNQSSADTMIRRKSWPCHRDSGLNSSLSSIIKPRTKEDLAWSEAVEDDGWVASGVTFSRTVEVYVFEDTSREALSRARTT